MKILTIKNYEQMERYISKEKFINFLFTHLGKYGDEKDAIEKSLNYAFSLAEGKGGFVLLGLNDKGDLIGGVVINQTAMSSYIPENILVYITVHMDHRGKGYGGMLIKKTLESCKGDVALHVDFDNPATRLYERTGFDAKYIEMRYKKDS